ncbi:hypothetical protein GQR60_09595 [Labilibaculum sp. A4]|uniref:hypothetical protein n=1 Tax=Labilibaculum euxinus TaxID=2686357 RepID=UPI000F61F128|nr:hypothetical protein [Labilibaculum euxinus]MDQ1771518.1 hypothetical protein [Labilibaculum euxinus]MWN76593.1 hypothetical protein [Labilibaculum euxinus]
MREVIKTETLNNFKDFSSGVGASLKIPTKLDIDSGGALQYLTINIEKELDNSKIVINQTFSYLFSQPEELVAQTGLILTIKKTVRSDFYLHFWQRELMDRIFSKDRINSGNPIFNKTFSVRSNNPNIVNSIFTNSNVQDLFLNNKFLVFNVNSNGREIKIKLKNMVLKKYETEEIENYYNNLLFINNLIKV